MIEQERINAIKRDVSLVDLVRSRGIDLKKNGKGYKGLCPFHDDKNSASLSVTPSQNLFQCFGCGEAGDVIKFVQLIDQVDFKAAVETLTGDMAANTKPEPKVVQIKQQKEIPAEKACQLLERVVSIYTKDFHEQRPGKAYLEGRGLVDAGLFASRQVGFCRSSLNEILPKDGSIREDLQQLGILDNKGRERFHNCLVIPVYDSEGMIVTLYGRSISEGNKRHLFLPDRPTGLWNSVTCKTFEVVILVESIIDGFSVLQAGFPNVVAIQGTWLCLRFSTPVVCA